jgi:tetratricopeptide (TPR) repeat protein
MSDLNLATQIVQASRQWQYAETVELCQNLLSNTSPEIESDQQYRLIALRESSLALWQLGQADAAWLQMTQYQQEAGEHSIHTIQALCQMAHLLTRRGAFELAKDKLDHAMKIANQLDYELGFSLVYHQRGRLAAFQGFPENALADYLKARAIYPKTGYLLTHFDLWSDIGFAYRTIGRIDKAIKAYDSALKLAHHLRHPKTCAVLNYLGECYQDLFDMEQAKMCHLQALEHVPVLAHNNKTFHRVQADIYRNLGVEYYYLGDMRAGRAALQKTLFMLDEQDSLEIRLKSLFTLSLIDLDQGDLTMAWQRAQELHDEADKNAIRGLQAWALYLLGLCCEQQDALDKAHSNWQQALFLAHDTDQRMLLWRVHAALARTAASDALAGVHYQIATEAIHQIVLSVEDVSLQAKFKQAPMVAQVLASSMQTGLFSQNMRWRFGGR